MQSVQIATSMAGSYGAKDRDQTWRLVDRRPRVTPTSFMLCGDVSIGQGKCEFNLFIDIDIFDKKSVTYLHHNAISRLSRALIQLLRNKKQGRILRNPHRKGNFKVVKQWTLRVEKGEKNRHTVVI